jgi:hypothetical protein
MIQPPDGNFSQRCVYVPSLSPWEREKRTLLIPQRLNRVEASRFAGRIEAEEDPYGGGEGNGQDNGVWRDDGRPVGKG